MYHSVKNQFHSKYARNWLRREVVELTNVTKISRDADLVGDYEILVDQSAHIGDISSIEGMGIWSSRVQI